MNEKVKPKKNPLIYVVIILLLILIGIGSYVGYMMVNKVNAEAPKAEITYSLDDFIINTADVSERRYLKTKIYFGYTEAKLTPELDAKKPIIRDIINSIFTSKKAAELNEPGLKKLKTEIMTKVNSKVSNGKINNVYYYDVLLQ